MYTLRGRAAMQGLSGRGGGKRGDIVAGRVWKVLAIVAVNDSHGDDISQRLCSQFTRI